MHYHVITLADVPITCSEKIDFNYRTFCLKYADISFKSFERLWYVIKVIKTECLLLNLI